MIFLKVYTERLGWVTAKLVKRNSKTVLVRLPADEDNPKGRVIKRRLHQIKEETYAGK